MEHTEENQVVVEQNPSTEATPQEEENITEAEQPVAEVEEKEEAEKEAPQTEEVEIARSSTPDVEETVIQTKQVAQEDDREPISLVFIGHVDAGKSTLAGNILFQMNEVDERTMQKYKEAAEKLGRASWVYAFVIDTNEEERAKGKTVEVGRAHFNTAKKRYTILDAPGHKDYVPNMIGGASQADIAILVISARKGEFETGYKQGGQTQEHATLVKMLGVKKIIIVINKMDEPTVEWSQERFDEIKNELLPFLTRRTRKSAQGANYGPSLEYSPDDLQWIPVSGYNGLNIIDRFPAGVCPWYDGPSLVEALDNMPPMSRSLEGPLRIPVLGSYKESGNVLLLGKVESGRIKTGQTVTLMPNQQTSAVSFLQLDTDEIVPASRAGENIRVALKDLSLKQVRQGFVLCEDSSLIPTTNTILAQLSIVDLPPGSLFTAGYTSMIHIHNVVEECLVDELVAVMDRKTRKWAKSRPFCKVGDVIKARLRFEQQICLERFEDHNQLGRFTLRFNRNTIAIGKVLETK